MPAAHLPSILTYSDPELRGLAMAASKRARNEDDSQPYRAMWHEISYLCAEEVDRRRALVTGMQRDVDNLPQEHETGGLIDGDAGLTWRADSDAAANAEDYLRSVEERFRRGNGAE